MTRRFVRLGIKAGALALLAISGPALAQPNRDAAAYPTKPVRMIVVFPPGSGTDIAARLVAQELSERFGKAFVIDNRAGAGGMVGTEAAANANPDGYTLLVVSSSYTINPSVYAKLPYDPDKAFAPISMLGSTPYLLVAHPSVQVKTVRDVIELAKAKPNQLNYGTGGIGVGSHLAGELFKTMAKVQIVMVPYKGAPQATADVVAGQVQLSFSTMPTALPLVQSGKLVAVGLTSLKRVPAVPDIPTFAESGLPGFEVETWFGMLAPAKIPPVILTRVHEGVVAAVHKDQVRDRLTAQGYQTVGNTPEAFGRQIKTETAKWIGVVKAAGIKPMGGAN
jgi:tripartite-type tricarboxylate transporter receptor subunit TctC